MSQPAGSRLGFPTWKVGAIYLAVRPLFRLFARAACVAAQTSVSCLERAAIFTAKDPTHAALSLFCLAIYSWDKPWYRVVHQWSFLRRPASVMRGRQQADPPHQQPDETAAPTSLQLSVISFFICYTEDLRGEGVRESGYGLSRVYVRRRNLFNYLFCWARFKWQAADVKERCGWFNWLQNNKLLVQSLLGTVAGKFTPSVHPETVLPEREPDLSGVVIAAEGEPRWTTLTAPSFSRLIPIIFTFARQLMFRPSVKRWTFTTAAEAQMVRSGSGGIIAISRSHLVSRKFSMNSHHQSLFLSHTLSISCS